MKRALCACLGIFAIAVVSPAGAADIPVKAPAPAVMAPAPVYNWSGWYVGAHVGGLWSEKEWTFVTDPVFTASPDPDGFLGGVQIGFDIQSGVWVFGIEGDASWADGSGSARIADSASGPVLVHSDVGFLATLTGRIGYAGWPQLLAYVKGGAAWADESHWSTVPGQSTPIVDQTRTGWTVGAGLEYAFAGDWSAKVEYNYMDFGTERIFLAGFNDTYDIDQNIHVVKFGLNYRFATGKTPVGKTPAPAPVVTKY